MEKDFDKDINGFVEDFSDQYGYGQGSKEIQRRMLNPGPSINIRTLALWGLFILVLSFFITLIFGGGSVPREEISAIQSRLEGIESKLAGIEDITGRLENLESNEKALRNSFFNNERSLKSLESRVDKISKTHGSRRDVSSGKPGTKKPESTSSGQSVKEPGHGLYHTVSSGDTLFGIAKKYQLALKELLRLNNLEKDHVLKPGQKLLVAPVNR